MKFLTQLLVEWYIADAVATYIAELVFDPAQEWSFFLGKFAIFVPTMLIVSASLKKAYEVQTQNIIQLKGEGVANLTDEELAQFKTKLKELEESK